MWRAVPPKARNFLHLFFLFNVFTTLCFRIAAAAVKTKMNFGLASFPSLPYNLYFLFHCFNWKGRCFFEGECVKKLWYDEVNDEISITQ